MCSLGLRYGSKITLNPLPDSNGRFAAWDWTMRCSRNRSLHGACREPGVRDGGCVRAQLAAGGRPAADGDPPQLVPRVTSQPAGIDCPPTCQASFPSGTSVTLLTNDGIWSGACTGETLQRCALVIDAPTEVGVTPTRPPPLPAVPRRPRGYVDVTVSGAGLVTSSDGQIQCGFSPRPSFHCHRIVPLNGTKLPLRANPRPASSLRPLGRLVSREARRPACSHSHCQATPPCSR